MFGDSPSALLEVALLLRPGKGATHLQDASLYLLFKDQLLELSTSLNWGSRYYEQITPQPTGSQVGSDRAEILLGEERTQKDNA